MPPKVRVPPSQNSQAVSPRGRFGPAGIHSGLVRKSGETRGIAPFRKQNDTASPDRTARLKARCANLDRDVG